MTRSSRRVGAVKGASIVTSAEHSESSVHDSSSLLAANADAKTNEPDERHSLNGYAFNFHDDVWQIDSDSSLNVKRLRRSLGPRLVDGCLRTLAHWAAVKAPSTCTLTASCLHDFASFAAPGKRLKSLSAADLTNYRANNVKRDGHEANLIKLRPFFLSWHDLRYGGSDLNAVEALKSWRLKRPEAGRRVRTMDAKLGPLVPSELHALSSSVLAAYERKLIDHTDLSVALFLIHTGRRPVQVSHLKCLDLDDSRVDDAVATGQSGTPRRLLLIHIPRAKQHGARFREHFRSVELIQSFWAMLVRQRGDVCSIFDDLLIEAGFSLQPSDIEEIHRQLPLIPSWSKIRKSLENSTKLLGEGAHGQALELLRKGAKSKMWHVDSRQIQRILRRAASAGDARSRTGAKLHMTPYRLRYTKGTEAAREGFGREVIAWLLDQSTLDSADIYIDNLPEHALPINKALALSTAMTGLARLFRGKLVDSEQDAVAGKDPASSRILFKGKGAATCGGRIQCGLRKLPIPCYTCDLFQPWLDGPHTQVLELLLEERQDRLDALGSDKIKIIEVADPTIVAVIDVIQRCEVRRLELQSSGDTKAGGKSG